jgi:Carboxypeptidase regulatory-like domain/TonB dependent receptor
MRSYLVASRRFLLPILVVLWLGCAAWSQTNSGSLHGTVTDPSAAAVTNATVIAVTPQGQTKTANTSRTGAYELNGLAPGTYTLTVNAPGFAAFTHDVQVSAGQSELVNVTLAIAVEKEKINVIDEGTTVTTDPANNAGAIILKGEDLDALPDDPDELQTDLEALAGPSAGPNGGQIYIDGFTAGQLPPKSSIREIRINQNPFSSEYDKLGYGRIEIFTKPGTDKLHGQVSVLGNASQFNSTNPFLQGQEPDYHSVQYMGNVGGPLGKKASFFMDAQRRNIDELSVITNCTNPPCSATDLTAETVPNPHTRTNLAPRIDYQISKNNTLTARYQYYRDTIDNAGLGQFTTLDQAYNNAETEHTVQISDTQVLSSKVINETRFQYLRDNSTQVPQSTAPTVNVMGSFISGGISGGSTTDHQDHYELQNYTSMSAGNHFFKFGGRLRVVHDSSLAADGFNGSWTFRNYPDYQNGQPFQYSVDLVPGATSSTIPTVTANVADAGLYFQDDWRWRPNLTVSYGLRFETQNAIGDHGDWAPRASIAWGIDGGQKNAAKTVLRAGFGMFYDRFNEANVLQTERLNGITQIRYIVTCPNPDDLQSCPFQFNYPTPPSLAQLQSTSPTTYQISPHLHSPYILQSALSLERQVTKNATVTLSYLNSRGFDQLLTRNINAPFNSADPNDPTVRPFGTLNNIYQYATEGIFRQNQLIVNTSIRTGRVTLFGFYVYNNVQSNTGGVTASSPGGSFPSNQYNLDADYGRAAYDVHHRLFFGGSIAAPYSFRLSPFMIVSSGAPYNVSLGYDLNGDSIINDRPSFSGDCSDPRNPCFYNQHPELSDPRIPVNYLTGPTLFTLNLRLSRTFGFGRERGGNANTPNEPRHGGGGGGHGPGGGIGGFGGGPGGMRAIFGPGSTNRRYNLTFSVNARNVLNRVNLGTPVGTVTSPFFGQSIALAQGPFTSQSANRKIELLASFSF